MLSGEDWEVAGPDEKAVFGYVAFLAARLLEASKDDRAALTLQRLWRARQRRSAGNSATEHLFISMFLCAIAANMRSDLYFTTFARYSFALASSESLGMTGGSARSDICNRVRTV